MTDNLRAGRVLRAGADDTACDRVELDYESRFLRRRRILTESGLSILVDLAETVSLVEGDALELDDGRRIAIAAAPETLLEIRGGDLVRLAWHIGNRHCPCQIEPGRLLIRTDPVLAGMLRHLGADVVEIQAAFRPEGGAYGHGRTLGHSHEPVEGGAYHHHAHAHDHG